MNKTDFTFLYICNRTSDHLGSGHFGLVSKGVWHSPGGPVEVAIKTLRSEASEEERVKFLQEAAIMGQFHHPNIVKLHGVVTVGDPVSWCYHSWYTHIFSCQPCHFAS